MHLLVFVSLVDLPASAQWVRWEAAAGGNGHWYRPVPGFTGLTWTMAEHLARAEGSYLATITSPAENALVFSLVDAPEFWTVFNGSGPAIGGFQQDGSVEPAEGWQWVGREAWVYSNWLPGRRDNYPGGPPEDRLHFWGGGPRAATWNDIGRDDTNLGGYIIETDTTPRPLLIAVVPLMQSPRRPTLATAFNAGAWIPAVLSALLYFCVLVYLGQLKSRQEFRRLAA